MNNIEQPKRPETFSELSDKVMWLENSYEFMWARACETFAHQINSIEEKITELEKLIKDHISNHNAVGK